MAQSAEHAWGDQVTDAVYDVLHTLDGETPPENNNGLPSHAPEQYSAAERMLREGYAAEGLTIRDCLATADTRDSPISYWPQAGRSGSAPTMTEGAALQQLDDFFRLAEIALRKDGNVEQIVLDYANLMASMRRELFFIGKPEFDEAAAGIAQLWRTYLADDPGLQLWVPYNILRSNSHFKSPQLLFQQVLSNFAYDDELLRRIVTDSNFEPDPDRPTKIILLDDWSKQGLQMDDVINALGLTHDDDIEMHLAAASDRQLAEGFRHRYYNPQRQPLHVPIRAYFRGGGDTCDWGGPPKGPLITGAHSSVDFDFCTIVDLVTRMVDETADPLTRTLPALAKIVRTPRPAPPRDYYY